MKLNTHINFDGQCEAAFRFYERCFGGKIVTMLRWGDSPMANEVPPEWRDKICHATLTIEGSELAGADVPPEQYEDPRGFQVLLGIDIPEDAERVFNELAEHGLVKMPLQKTFWAARYGIVVDRFGVPWEVNCDETK